MTLKNKRVLLLCYFKLCVSFCSHQSIQTGVTVGKHPIRVKMGNFLSHVTLKFDGWLWKTIGHLFYATSSFVHHIIAISQLKLELQSGNAKFGGISTFLAATKQLYEWYFLSVCPSVCPSHFFYYVPLIVSSWNFQELSPRTRITSMQKVKVKGQGHRGHNPT